MNTLVWIFLALAILSIVVTIVLLFIVFETGTARGRLSKSFSTKDTTRESRLLLARSLEKHLKWVDRFLGITIVSVILIEGVIRARYGFSGGRIVDTDIGVFHLLFDAIYAICLLLMRFVVTGLRSKTWHIVLFIAVVFIYFFVVITGMLLVNDLISRVAV